jgi:hypothetical protein
MIRFQVVGSQEDMCSLPSPRRIPRSLAGMAFNFSKIELTPPAKQVMKPTPPQSQPALSSSAQADALKMCGQNTSSSSVCEA